MAKPLFHCIGDVVCMCVIKDLRRSLIKMFNLVGFAYALIIFFVTVPIAAFMGGFAYALIIFFVTVPIAAFMGGFAYSLIIFFVIVLPIAAFIGPLLYKAWKWLPHFVQYVLFIPVSYVFGLLMSFPIAAMLLREFVFFEGDNFWKSYVFPALTPVISTLITSVFILWLCPRNEKRALKIVLILNAILILGVWGFLLVASFTNDIPFWYETTATELIDSAGAIFGMGLVLLNITWFHETFRGAVEPQGHSSSLNISKSVAQKRAVHPNDLSDDLSDDHSDDQIDDEELTPEMKYYEAVENHIESINQKERVLVIQAMDQDFFEASFNLYKVGYEQGTNFKFVACAAVDAAHEYDKNPEYAVLFLEKFRERLISE